MPGGGDGILVGLQFRGKCLTRTRVSVPTTQTRAPRSQLLHAYTLASQFILRRDELRTQALPFSPGSLGLLFLDENGHAGFQRFSADEKDAALPCGFNVFPAVTRLLSGVDSFEALFLLRVPRPPAEPI